MAAMNSSVLACSYAISGAGSSELNAKLTSVASPVASNYKLPSIKAQQQPKITQASEGRRAALVSLAATIFATTAAVASNSAASAGVIEEYLERSKANKV